MGVSAPPARSLPHAAEGATLPSGENLALNTFLPPPPAFLTHALPSSYFRLQPLEVGTGRDPCSHFTDGEPIPESGKVRTRESYFMQAERKQLEALLYEETLRPLQRRLCEGWGPGRGQGRPGVPQPQDQHLLQVLLEGRTGTQAAYRPRGLEECLVISPRFYRARETEAGR